VEVEAILQREDLGPLGTIRGRRARGPRHTSGIRETMKQDAFVLLAIRDALTAACAREKRSYPRRDSGLHCV
jgi:hypothetical protein